MTDDGQNAGLTVGKVALTEYPERGESLVQMAVQNGSDIDVIERMAALMKEEREDQRKRAFFAALGVFQAECPRIDKSDAAHNTKYAKLERITQAIKPAMQAAARTLASHSFGMRSSSR